MHVSGADYLPTGGVVDQLMDKHGSRRDGFFARLRRFRREERGVTAVEFALLAGPFFLLLFAIIETSITFFANANMDSVVAQAGRMIRTGQAQVQGWGEADFVNYICDRMTLITDCTSNLYVDVQTFQSFDTVVFAPLIDADGNVIEQHRFEPGTDGDIVLVRAYYLWHVVSPAAIGLANTGNDGRLLVSSVAFRNEPFGSILSSGN